MLTQELIKANESLAGLTDEQISAITTLSQNDENAVIGNRFGEVYRTFDENIAKASGIARNGDEKTYVYLDRVLGELKRRGAEASEQVTALTKENARLQKAIQDGTADTEAKKALVQAQKDLTAITSQYNTLKAEFDKQEEQHKQALFALQIDSELSNAKNGVRFKAGLPSQVTEVIMRNAVENVKRMNPEYVDNGAGGRVLVFKDKEGAIMRNPESQLNPFTASELLRKELKAMGVLDDGVHQQGTGTEPTAEPKQGAVDISGARTRMEATDIISKQLMQKGLIKGSSQFQKEFDEAWKINNVASLPMQ